MAVKTKKAQPTAAQSSFLPPENIWSALRAAKEKTAQRAANSDFSPFLVRMKGLEPSRPRAHAPKACSTSVNTPDDWWVPLPLLYRPHKGLECPNMGV